MPTFDVKEQDYLPSPTAPVADPRECVLLIEDDLDAMVLVRHALQNFGRDKYRLEWSEDLNSAIDKISKGGIDIILLDLGLPDSSGAWSYSWVHQVAPEIPVVVLTADSREGTEFAVIARGGDDFLVKGQASGAVVVKTIRSVLDLSKQRQMNQMAELAQHTKTLLLNVISPAPQDADLKIEKKELRFLPDGF
jgi:sigma-B regulation protein RsbU (phosphoserine phosphatase)